MSSKRRTAVRRRDRAVDDDAWLADALRRANVGVLATAPGGAPMPNSNLFVYDEERHAIYLHTAARGATRDSVGHETQACFTIHELGRLLPAPTALEFSCEYASVVAFGTIRIVRRRSEQRRALQSLLNKYFGDLTPGTDYRAITDAELRRTTVFRLDLEEWIGKKKQVASNFPGARPSRPPNLVGRGRIAHNP